MALFEPSRSSETEEILGSDAATRALSVTAVENDFVTRVYEKLATVYDFTFGPVLHPGRVDAIERMGIRPGDRVLEFSSPRGWLGGLYRRYFRGVLPRIGALVSGDAGAYAYLPASVDRFPSPPAFAASMERAGFTAVTWRLLTGGIACLHRGDRG